MNRWIQAKTLRFRRVDIPPEGVADRSGMPASGPCSKDSTSEEHHTGCGVRSGIGARNQASPVRLPNERWLMSSRELRNQHTHGLTCLNAAVNLCSDGQTTSRARRLGINYPGDCRSARRALAFLDRRSTKALQVASGVAYFSAKPSCPPHLHRDLGYTPRSQAVLKFELSV